MDAFIASFLAVALAEVGDKTQLLALFLTAVFARKFAIVCGIFIATVLNHAVSAWFGMWIAEHLNQTHLSWIVAISFIAVGLWLLIPDKDDAVDEKYMQWGALVATTILFFFAEIGDKTQIATVLLAANYQNFSMVLVGSTAGMLLANVPVVYLGAYLMKLLPFKLVRIGACILFLLLGVATLLRHYYF
ncbi:TMEM165/GDT1 family protein [Oligella urethralis]|uniref:TMEM165/GDT1 family protein n=1 Tax=Oligella urethralis TaxID=90245 RepID=UPI0028893910|nr:TMEM165/GDT1 family protein [Oligella urethralis]